MTGVGSFFRSGSAHEAEENTQANKTRARAIQLIDEGLFMEILPSLSYSRNSPDVS
jgi:hypothetical protein